MKESWKPCFDAWKEEQKRLITAAAELSMLPSNSTLERVAQLELNIAAIEHTLDETE